MASTQYTHETAVKIAKAAGYTPLEEYPGLATKRWLVGCNTCKAPRSVSLNYLSSGRNLCPHIRRQFASGPRVQRAASAEAREKYDNGASVRALADEYGVSYGTMHRLLVNAGVKMRARGAQKRSAPGA